MKNNIIREKRRLSFNLKIITPQTIRSFSDIIEKEISSLSPSEESDCYIMYSVDATDNTSFESQSNDIFKENQIIENRVIRKVNMRFYTKNNSKNIEVQLIHLINDENSENYISVSGDEPNWVNGVLSRLSQILDNTQNQSKFTVQFSGYFLSILFILANVEYFRLIFDKLGKTPYEIVAFINVLGFPIATFIGAIQLNSYIKKLWPDIELQTGPMYLQFAATKRNKMQWVMVSIILPILLTVIYDMTKSFLLS
jgi:hypothetical protein